MDRVAIRVVASQRVEIVTWKVYVLGRGRDIQDIQTPQDALRSERGVIFV